MANNAVQKQTSGINRNTDPDSYNIAVRQPDPDQTTDYVAEPYRVSARRPGE